MSQTPLPMAVTLDPDVAAEKDRSSRFRQILRFIKEQWVILGFAFACLMGYLFPGESIKRAIDRARLLARDRYGWLT